MRIFRKSIGAKTILEGLKKVKESSKPESYAYNFFKAIANQQEILKDISAKEIIKIHAEIVGILSNPEFTNAVPALNGINELIHKEEQRKQEEKRKKHQKREAALQKTKEKASEIIKTITTNEVKSAKTRQERLKAIQEKYKINIQPSDKNTKNTSSETPSAPKRKKQPETTKNWERIADKMIKKHPELENGYYTLNMLFSLCQCDYLAGGNESIASHIGLSSDDLKNYLLGIFRNLRMGKDFEQEKLITLLEDLEIDADTVICEKVLELDSKTNYKTLFDALNGLDNLMETLRIIKIFENEGLNEVLNEIYTQDKRQDGPWQKAIAIRNKSLAQYSIPPENIETDGETLNRLIGASSSARQPAPQSPPPIPTASQQSRPDQTQTDFQAPDFTEQQDMKNNIEQLKNTLAHQQLTNMLTIYKRRPSAFPELAQKLNIDTRGQFGNFLAMTINANPKAEILDIITAYFKTDSDTDKLRELTEKIDEACTDQGIYQYMINNISRQQFHRNNQNRPQNKGKQNNNS